MGNHYHLLVETPLANLSLAMRQINGVYTRYFNLRWKRSGHLFQSRFKAIVVQKDAYLLTLSRYIHQNPLKANLVGSLEDYPWSSCPAYLGQVPAPPWLYLADILSYFESDRQDAAQNYRSFVLEKEEDDPIRHAAAKMILGSEDFVDTMKARAKTQAAGDTEYSRRKELERLFSADSVLQAVAGVYGIRLEDLAGGRYKRLEARHMAMYLLREKAGLSLPVVAQRLNVTYSGVSRAIQRFRKKTLPGSACQKYLTEIVRRLY